MRVSMKAKNFIPTFIPVVLELLSIFKRNAKHDQNIRKKDRTAEKIGSLEHLMVRLEKKVQQNRDYYQKSIKGVRIWLAINSALLIAILVKLFIG